MLSALVLQAAFGAGAFAVALPYRSSFQSLHKRDDPIQFCPTSETPIVLNSVTFVSCANSDYHTGSNTVINNIASDADCAQQCASQDGCTNAVYDKLYNLCHIKPASSFSSWSTSTSGEYDTVHIAQSSVDIDTCQAITSTTVANGQTFTVCPNSDYRVGSTQVINNINSIDDCAQQCSTISGCQAGSFDKIYNICHIKGPAPASGLFVSTSLFDSFSSVPPTAQTTSTSVSELPTPTDDPSTSVSSTSGPTSTDDPTTSTSTDDPSTPTPTDDPATPTSTDDPSTPTPTDGSTTPTGPTSDDAHCPNNDGTTYNTSGGLSYLICPNAEYQGTSLGSASGVASPDACAELCSNVAGCVRVNFDPSVGQCSMISSKGDNTVYTSSQSFSTATMIPPAETQENNWLKQLWQFVLNTF